MVSTHSQEGTGFGLKDTQSPRHPTSKESVMGHVHVTPVSYRCASSKLLRDSLSF